MTDLPRTPQQILEEYERRSKELFDFGTSDLIEVLPFDMARKYLKDEITYAEWDKIRCPATKEAVLERMNNYVSFAWSKVTGHRGISAGRNLDHYRSWCWLLGDDDTVRMIEGNDVPYAPYGAPKLAEVCRKYKFEIPDDAKTMASGSPCSPYCSEGCLS